MCVLGVGRFKLEQPKSVSMTDDAHHTTHLRTYRIHVPNMD